MTDEEFAAGVDEILLSGATQHASHRALDMLWTRYAIEKGGPMEVATRKWMDAIEGDHAPGAPYPLGAMDEQLVKAKEDLASCERALQRRTDERNQFAEQLRAMPLNPPTPASVEAVAQMLAKAPPLADWQAMFDVLGLTPGNAYPKLLAALAYQAQGEGGDSAVREALAKAAERFREYERHHYAEAARHIGSAVFAKTRREKGARNREMAEMCEAALAQPTTAGQGDVACDLAQEVRSFAMNMRRDDSDARSSDLVFYYEAIEQFADRIERLSLPPSPPNDEGLRELKVALVQAAVPLEALLICKANGAVDLSDHSWGEIENAVAHIRAALERQP